MRVAIVGGGISGVTAAWQLARLGVSEVVLYEASPRLGGTVETIRRDGFIIEGGPDGWVSEKPWARDLAIELGLEDELIGSNDAARVTYIVQQGKLIAMPDGMRMMVPTNLAALEDSPLFSPAARAAYASEPARAGEFRASAPQHDESIAQFVRRHFGEEVLAKIAGPLLSGVFGGDVETLSMRAVMPRFVDLEHAYGSLVTALAGSAGPGPHAAKRQSIFTSLTTGTGTLVERMVAEIPTPWLRLQTAVSSIQRADGTWRVTALGDRSADTRELFDALLLAVPAHVALRLLRPLNPRMVDLLDMESSSAVLAALAFDVEFPLPQGFGFLVPAGQGSTLLAGTFVDQKFPARVPLGHRLLRGFFGGDHARTLAPRPDSEIAARALTELTALLGPLPKPIFSIVRRWPSSLPQYAVGHLDRMQELASLTQAQPGLHLLGNPYHGVGLPDLIHSARSAARQLPL